MILTVITPTTGKKSLMRLIETIDQQDNNKDIYHLLLWDNVRDQNINPKIFNKNNRFSLIAPAGSGKNINAPGSILRSIGLLVARTPYITFADDDVWWEKNHFIKLKEIMNNYNWGSTLRKIYSPKKEYLGIDKFESVGDDPTKKVSYEMCDNNVMFFKREFASVAAQLYRETTEYNDDRLMYAFLKKHAGIRGRTNVATINQTCPEKLMDFFKINCEK
jgi:hypothetical protein